MVPQSGFRRRRISSPWSPLTVVISGGLQGLADSLLQPIIILSTLAFLLGGTNYQIAAFAVIAAACWSLGGLLVEPLVLLVKGTRPIAIAGIILRTGAIMLLGLIGYRLERLHPANALAGLILCFAAYELGALVTASTTNGQVALAYSPAKRAAIFRWRALAAAIAAILGGLAAQGTFGSALTPFPTSGKYLLMLASLSVIAATWFLIQVPLRSRQFGQQGFSPIGPALRSASIRRYLTFRLLLGLAAFADPLVIVYGLQRIGFNLRYVGIALVCYALLQLLGTAIWSDRIAARNHIRLLQFATFLRLIFLILAISIPALASSTFYADRFDSPRIAAWAFAAAFGLLGLAASIHNHVNQRYLIDIAVRDGVAPPQSAIAVSNLMLGILAFAPLVGAWVATRFSLEAAITTGGTFAFLAFLSSAALVASRARGARRRSPLRVGARRARVSR
ncbi:MAG: hypothetical protein WBA63_17550 [Thermomicrobiales bacterium]